jgi:uncharacterized protein
VIDPTAFQQYRQSPNSKTTLLRLIIGTVIVVACWMLSTLVVIFGGTYAYAHWFAPITTLLPDGDMMRSFITSPTGVLTALLSFSGIWVGLMIVMPLLHKERLTALFGTSRRINWSDFAKGLIAVLITSVISEILLYALKPGFMRGSISVSSWLLFLVPTVLLTFLQTSAEEMLFRAYLPRGLAKRFRSPIIWGFLPLLTFTSLHWSGGTNPAINAAGLTTIFAFALVLMSLVYATGNLGASFGAHLGNNLFGFLLISHQQSYDAFAFFTAKPLEASGWSALDATLIAAIGIIASALTAVLLFHSRSPLRVGTTRQSGHLVAAERPVA